MWPWPGSYTGDDQFVHVSPVLHLLKIYDGMKNAMKIYIVDRWGWVWLKAFVCGSDLQRVVAVPEGCQHFWVSGS